MPGGFFEHCPWDSLIWGSLRGASDSTKSCKVCVFVWGRPPHPRPFTCPSPPPWQRTCHPACSSADPSWPGRRAAASGCRGSCRICASYLGRGEAGGREALSRPICPSLSDVLSWAFSGASVLWSRNVVCCVTAGGWPGRRYGPAARTEDAPLRGSWAPPGVRRPSAPRPRPLDIAPFGSGKGPRRPRPQGNPGPRGCGVSAHHVENRRSQNRINRGQFPPLRRREGGRRETPALSARPVARALETPRLEVSEGARRKENGRWDD